MSSRVEPADAGEGIAVVGLAGRFPKAANVEEFWRNLRDGVEGISSLSDEELLAAGVGPDLITDPRYVKAAAYVDDCELFDAAFFGIGPREAEILDPQQRLLLETAWEALESAGYDPAVFLRRIGFYAGGRISDYFLFNLSSNPELTATVGALQTLFANDKDYLATFCSYRLNLRGPSITVQTACSSALVAVHLACESLLGLESDMALAGGISLRLPAKAGYIHQEGGILSRDGHCRSFDAAASGTVFGNGVGVVVLRRLADALADGDPVLAVILGSAVNNDGGRKLGFAAPSEEGQASVIAEALEVAAVDPESIGYVEAHGSATPLGDPIEVAALTRAFRDRTSRNGFCALGSVKSSVGHLEAAAGIAGLIKTILMLQHRAIAPSLHFARPNPEIDFANSPFRVATALAPWAAPPGQPRRAGVNSFGLGGTNAHIVLEEAPERPPTVPSRPAHLLVLSARSAAALAAAARRLRDHLRSHPEACLADVAYTCQVGRRLFAHRLALVCGSLAEAVELLDSRDPRRVASGVQETTGREVAFLLPGLGEHYPGMGAGLYRGEETFRRAFDRCAELLAPDLGVDLRGLLFSPPAAGVGGAGAVGAGGGPPDAGLDLRRLLRRGPQPPSGGGERLDETWIAQPAVFALEYALAQLWISWGVRPRAMIGYSLGELVAACLAGVMSLPDGLRLVALRARLIEAQAPGRMLAVPLGVDRCRELLAPLPAAVAVAAINGPEDCVLAGPEEAIREIELRLASRQIQALRLPARHAFHSPLLAPAAAALTDLAASIRLSPPAIPYISNLTGTWIEDAAATDPAYWARHMCETVRFADGLERICEQPGRVLLEVGPGQSLGTLARRRAPQEGGAAPLVLTSLRHRAAVQDAQEDVPFLLATLGRLWLAGVAVDWAGFHGAARPRRVALPTYPFERRRYWVEPRLDGLRPARRPADAVHPADAANPAEAAHLGDAADPAAAAERRRAGGLSGWLYLPLWRETPAARLAEPVGTTSVLLLFADGRGLGEALAARFGMRGDRVRTVAAGSGFRTLGRGRYAIDPRRPADYDLLLRDLAALGGLPQTVVHLGSLDAAGGAARAGAVGDDSAFACQDPPGLDSLVLLAQAFGRSGARRPVRFNLVTAGVAAVTGHESLVPERALAFGFMRVAPQEYPGLTCKVVDLALGGTPPATMAEVAEQVAAEIAGAPVEEPAASFVALRGSRRWVQVYSPAPLPPSVRAARAAAGASGAVLITGGLGGLGLAIAEHLARRGGARLALLGRSSLPEREGWESWLAEHGENDAAGRRIARLLRLEALGAEVLALTADVAREDDMRRALGLARRRFGALQVVLHAAGLPGGGLIQLQSPADMARIWAPKVIGAQLLDRLLADSPPEILILFSSTLAELGGVGQTAYCAANAFLDAFAGARTAAGRGRTLAIGWDRWLGVGMAAGAAAPAEPADGESHGGSGAAGIAPAQGLEVLDRLLAGPAPPHVVISTEDFNAALGSGRRLRGHELAEAAAGALRPASAGHPRPELHTEFVAPAGAMEQLLAAVWQELLGIDRVGIDDNFFELGGDSLRAIQLVAQARRRGLDLTTQQLFARPTIAALAAGLAATRADEEDAGGMSPLTPLQEWFWSQGFTAPARRTVGLGFATAGSPAVAGIVAARLAARHDGLRLRFAAGGSAARQQVFAAAGLPSPFSWIDLSGLPRRRREAATAALWRALEGSLDLDAGPLWRLIGLEGPAGEGEILLVAHELLAAGGSLCLLLAALGAALGPEDAGGQSPWRTAPASLRPAASRGRAGAVAGGGGPGEALHATPDLFPPPVALRLTLSSELTRQLLAVPAANPVAVDEILPIVFAQAVSAWSGVPSLVVHVLGAAAAAPIGGAVPAAVRLTPAGEVDAAAALLRLKEQWRAGLLPWTAGKAGAAGSPPADRGETGEAPPRLLFTDLGNLDAALAALAETGGAPVLRPPLPGGEGPYLLALRTAVAGGRLHLDLTGGGRLCPAAAVAAIGAQLQAGIAAIVEHCKGAGAAALTPSDFPRAGLAQDELDALLEAFDAAGERP
jgi:acyl transferase domain-containing protein/aryl carrier-like protein